LFSTLNSFADRKVYRKVITLQQKASDGCGGVVNVFCWYFAAAAAAALEYGLFLNLYLPRPWLDNMPHIAPRLQDV
jgi:hypothetical protein